MFNPPIFLALFPVFIGALVLFDRLVWREYFSHRTDWEADGNPPGFFWIPPESRLTNGWLRLDSLVASRRNSFVWLISTPGWARQDRRARRLLIWLRILVLIWTAGLVGAVVARLFA
jgi:hypothetical protein